MFRDSYIVVYISTYFIIFRHSLIMILISDASYAIRQPARLSGAFVVFCHVSWELF